MSLSQERLKELLSYNPEIGEFRWTKARRGVVVGALCGRISKGSGYRDIGIDCVLYRSHRLAFLYMLGRWPEGDVDHINRDRADNRWCNLREATRSQNSANVAIGLHRNTSGLVGVVWDKARQKWRAQIRISGRKTNLGRFDAKEDAVRAYNAAALRAFGPFAQLNGNSDGGDLPSTQNAACVSASSQAR